MSIRLFSGCLLLLSIAGLVAACSTARGDPSRPIPKALVPAPQAPLRLVVVLPGRADDLAAMQRGGIAEAIQRSWPDADVLLAGLTVAYYLDGQAPHRLHDEVMVPARKRGYREVWLSGASLGGVGSVMYDRAYPGEMDGIVLLAPWLGGRAILREIRKAGGIERWDPGPPQAIDADNWQREMWRHLQRLARDPDMRRKVWLAYGERDHLGPAIALLTPLLHEEHVLVRPGGHSWRAWSPAMGDVLKAAADEQETH